MKREKHLERALKCCKRELQIFLMACDDREIKQSYMSMVEAIRKANIALKRRDK